MLDNSLAEALLTKFKEALREAQDEKFRADQRAYEFKRDAQKYCIHPTTRETDGGDYHRGIFWKETYCTVCAKQLTEDGRKL